MGRAFEVRKAAMAKTSAAKAKVYARFGREIYVAAKAGVADPEMNVGLKRIIEKARSQQVPSDVINRAIDKAKGGSGEDYHAVRYEGFGPGSSTVIVECLTDNDNRTVSEVRNCFTKSQGKLGVHGSVAHAYTHAGILSCRYLDDEAILESLLVGEVEPLDIEQEDDMITITVETIDLYKAKEAIESALGAVEFDVVEISYLPTDYVVLSDDEHVFFEKLLSLLDGVDDVQQIYHNVDLTQEQV